MASSHGPGSVRTPFSRVSGLRKGVLHFYIPAGELTPTVIEALYDLDRDLDRASERPLDES